MYFLREFCKEQFLLSTPLHCSERLLYNRKEIEYAGD